MIDRISLLIRAKNLSAAQFADEIGVQRSSISHLMSGRNKPSLDLIQKTLERFPEVSTEWLLFGKGEMVRELNLFDSPARLGWAEKENKVVQPNIEANEGDDSNAAEETDMEITAKPTPDQAENAKSLEFRKGDLEDADQVMSQLNRNKKSAVDQIIILYEDRTFISYSPGN